MLSKYPRLHQLLKNDSQANTEFNAAIAEVTRFSSAPEESLVAQLETSETNLQKCLDKCTKMEKLTEATVRFIRLLGETIEVQTQLSPYTEDLAKNKDYTVHFTAEHIRLALHLHWDIIGSAMENELLRTVVVDPAAERENA
jgi:hypothetical protein